MGQRVAEQEKKVIFLPCTEIWRVSPPPPPPCLHGPSTPPFPPFNKAASGTASLLGLASEVQHSLARSFSILGWPHRCLCQVTLDGKVEGFFFPSELLISPPHPSCGCQRKRGPAMLGLCVPVCVLVTFKVALWSFSLKRKEHSGSCVAKPGRNDLVRPGERLSSLALGEN